VVTRRLGPPETSTPIWDLDGNATQVVWWFYNNTILEEGEVRQAWLIIDTGRVVQVRLGLRLKPGTVVGCRAGRAGRLRGGGQGQRMTARACARSERLRGLSWRKSRRMPGVSSCLTPSVSPRESRARVAGLLPSAAGGAASAGASVWTCCRASASVDRLRRELGFGVEP
jgi:hypothetical protein